MFHSKCDVKRLFRLNCWKAFNVEQMEEVCVNSEDGSRRYDQGGLLLKH